MFKEIQSTQYTHSTDFSFEALCTLLKEEKYALAIKQINTLMLEINWETLLFDPHNYTRNIIINNEHYWLSLLNWDKSAITRVHGHPDQAFMYVIKGQLLCKNFDNNSLLATNHRLFNKGEYQHNKGIKGRMDNYIHQISAKEKSLSLHFYSDNPSKGVIFDF